MNIWFFEEFPNRKNLEKAKFLTFPSVIFLGAKSFKDFQGTKTKLNQINSRVEAAYWPILKDSYWVSGFSNTYELENLYSELAAIDRQIKVLIDLEPPTMKPSLFIKNFSSLTKNKTIVQKILGLKNIKTFTAHYPNISISKRIMKMLGIIYQGNTSIPMCYTSMVIPPLKTILRKTKSEYVGLGVIANGILKVEKILKPEELNKDLDTFQNLGTKTVVIFRLGGLNEDYLRVINKYV